MTTRSKPDDRMSRCISALMRFRRSQELGAREISYYGIGEEFYADQRRKGIYPDDKARQIILDFGYAGPLSFAVEVAQRLGCHPEVRVTGKFDGEYPYVLVPDIGRRHSELFDYIIPDCRKHDEFQRFLASTP